ncbi:MAG: polysaccharide deacetylase family protein [Firmicutes bacterium]|nr:polysaccharide deacetylase family protein [Bacillota bacterium]
MSGSKNSGKFWFLCLDARQIGRRVGMFTLFGVWIMSLVFAITLPYWRSTIDVMVMGESAPQAIYRGDPAQPLMSFAVNVDWGQEVLPDMLRIFEKENVRVTFFVTGRWAKLYPDVLREMAEAGHEIANHGMQHDHPLQLGDWALTMHILENQKLLTEIIGSPVQLYAPPYGEVDRRIVATANNLGFHTIMWTIDTIDWQEPSVETTVRRVVDKAENGAIVLMHPKPNTAKALPQMIEGLRQKGFLLVPIGHLLKQ